MRKVLLVCVLILAGCKLEVPQFSLGTTPDSTAIPVSFTCEAVANGGLAAESGETISVVVSVNGFYGPFTSLDIEGEFSGSAEVYRSYKNDGVNEIITADSILIKDGLGFEKECPFRVTVLPRRTESDLSCVLSAEYSIASVNDTVTLTVIGSGGMKPFLFKRLSHGGTTVTSLTKRSEIHATSQVTFSTSGSKTLSAELSDDLGNTHVCFTVVEVRQPVSVPSLPPCTVATAFNPSFIGESVVVTAAVGVSINMNLGPAVLVDVQSVLNSTMKIDGRLSDTQAEVVFYNSGHFPVVAHMEYLLSGRRVQCSVMHSVYGYFW